jgi:hypothetical protein
VDVPRFFFDTHDGRDGFRDEVGVELPTADDVADEAFGLLRDLSHHAMPRGDTVLSASVRGPDGIVVFRATMTIAITWDPEGAGGDARGPSRSP